MGLLDALLPVGSGFLLSALLGYLLIPWFRRLGVGQHIRSEGPKSHRKKAGTPTMGGFIFIVGTVGAAALYHAFSGTPPSKEEILLLGLMLAYGFTGFLDDILKVRRARNLGLIARQKLALQGLFAVLFLWRFADQSWVVIPFTGHVLDLKMAYPPLAVLLIVGMGNAVNLTDGLDGLASGVSAVGLLAYAVVSMQSAGVLGYSVAPVALSGAGAVLGFLVHNRHPARIFMGDIGSLALGGLLSGLAVCTKAELLILFFATVPLVEEVSVVLQVAAFQLTGKRIFKMSPLHHHFELSGWKETTVVWVFWLAALLFACLGIVSMAYV